MDPFGCAICICAPDDEINCSYWGTSDITTNRDRHGYLGATHAACMAELGFEVLGVDVDKEKIDSLSRGELPIHEPGLPELLRKHTESGRLRFTTSFEEAGAFGDVHFIAVGTPQRAPASTPLT